MSNSSLVDYTKLSPNHSGKRTMSVDRISPHCVVGQCSVETLGNIFASTSAEASCNYCIGNDGRVGLIVDESNRSWCTSTGANDQRAVTIECASDREAPYAMKDVVYNKLVKLCVDICKRYGKKKLLWFGDKTKTLNYSPKSDEMIITVHRWFANKSCPGDWLYSRLSKLATDVTKQLGGASTSTASSSSSSSSTKTSTATSAKPTVTYCVRTKNHGWLPTVKNLDDYAGIEGDPITDFAIKVDKGSVWYQAHVKGGGWLPKVSGFSTSDTNSYAGIGKEIDAVRIYYSTPQSLINSGKVYKAKYRVSPTNSSGYYDWQYDNETSGGQDGYAGAFGKSIDKLQITIS